jgi:beta-N-acetylhexosaminidase
LPEERGAAPRAVVFGCADLELNGWERGFFAEADPLGFILFGRNCESPAQVRALVASLRATVGRQDAPVMIDQEGGRVARLTPPHWAARPAAACFGELAARDPDDATRAVWLNARLLATDLQPLGITVDCAPLLDLRWPEGHDVIGDRAFGDDPARVAALGRAFCDGLMAGGVLPVVKHIPGHLALPVVEASREELEATDFAAFRLLKDAPWAMTAHVVYSAIDAEAPATTSLKVISEIIRGTIEFHGILLSDDLSMSALDGDLGARAAAALAAGCDVNLHCNGDPAEMEAVAAATGRLGAAAKARLAGRGARCAAPQPFDTAAAGAELDQLLDHA